MKKKEKIRHKRLGLLYTKVDCKHPQKTIEQQSKQKEKNSKKQILKRNCTKRNWETLHNAFFYTSADLSQKRNLMINLRSDH